MNEILDDCKPFADKHRGKNKQSGPHWSTIIRFADLYDEAVRLYKRVETLEAYIADFCTQSIDALDLHRESDVPKLKDIPAIIEQLNSENKRLTDELAVERDKHRWIAVDYNDIKTHPKEVYKEVLFTNGRYVYIGYWFNNVSDDEDYFVPKWVDGSEEVDNVIGWMELPQPPQEGE